MPSPFPGMDPFLETPERWPAFRKGIVDLLCTAVGPCLPDRYAVRSSERRFSDVAEHREEFLEIVRREGGQRITLVDVVGPANKRTAAGREAFLATQRSAAPTECSWVEIDLSIQGEPIHDFSREGLPKFDYSVTVMRSSRPSQFELYTAILQTRLPRFRIPFARDERDTVVDLQAAFTACYERLGFGGAVDYADAPAFLHDRIAMLAYVLWQRDGCRHGSDKEHWREAIRSLPRSGVPQ
jgi:hypothetical protein